MIYRNLVYKFVLLKNAAAVIDSRILVVLSSCILLQPARVSYTFLTNVANNSELSTCRIAP